MEDGSDWCERKLNTMDDAEILARIEDLLRRDRKGELAEPIPEDVLDILVKLGITLSPRAHRVH